MNTPPFNSWLFAFLRWTSGKWRMRQKGLKAQKADNTSFSAAVTWLPTITLVTVLVIKSQTCLWSPAVARLNLATQVFPRRNHMLCGNLAYFRRWGGQWEGGRESGVGVDLYEAPLNTFFLTVGLVGCASSVQPHPESFTSRAEDARPPGSTSGTKDSSSAERAATPAAVRGNCCSQMCLASLI